MKGQGGTNASINFNKQPLYHRGIKKIINIRSNSLVMMIGMLLVSRSGLVEEDAVEGFRYYGFHIISSFLM